MCLQDEWPWTLHMLKPRDGIDNNSALTECEEKTPPYLILHDIGLFVWKEVRLWANTRDACEKASLQAAA